MPYTFGKEERLCSRSLMDRLYADGHRLMAFPFSVQWLVVDGPQLCQIMIVAPKRRFHHAVDRNHVRRLTRECWRLRKSDFYSFLLEHNITLALSLVYVHNEIMPYDQLGHKMDKLIAQLQQDILKSLES
jgi:ribonuclease P protein component